METQRLLCRTLMAASLLLAVGEGLAQTPPAGFPLPVLPGGLPFIPVGPQPDAVPPNSQGWREIVNEYGPPVKGRAAKLVENVVAELSRGAGRIAPKGGYQGTLLDTPVLNAFAISDGNVFVTRQLLAYMNDEDELIGVLGHEVGHVIGGHSRFGAAAHAGQAVGGQLLGAFLMPVSGVAQFGGTVVVRGFDRAQEHAADVAGVKFLADLGRDPAAMGRALDILEEDAKLEEKIFGARPPGAFDYWLRDHPVHSERRGLVNLAASLAPRVPPQPHRSPPEFVRELDGLLFDDGPDQGIVDGSSFRHPVLKFALDAAPGLRLLNGSSALMLSAPGGSSGTLKIVDGGGSEVERFRAAWARSFPPNIPAPTPSVMKRNAMVCTSGHIDTQLKDGSVRISMWLFPWSDTQSFIYAAVDPGASHAEQHSATAESFRRLSNEEAAAVHVRRLRVVDVTDADSVASLSQHMAYADFREERFRLINGLSNDAPLPRSGPVKLVVWVPQ